MNARAYPAYYAPDDDAPCLFDCVTCATDGWAFFESWWPSLEPAAVAVGSAEAGGEAAVAGPNGVAAPRADDATAEGVGGARLSPAPEAANAETPPRAATPYAAAS